MDTILLDNIPVAVFVANLADKTVKANRQCIELLGLETASLSELKSGFTQPEIFDTDCDKSNIETSIFGPDGKVQKVLLNIKCTSATEQVVTMSVFNIGVEALAKNPLIKEFAGDTPLMIWVKDMTNNKLLWNTPNMLTFGYTPEELANLTWEDITYIEDVERQKCTIKQAQLLSKNYYLIEKRMLSKSGKMYWVREYSKDFTVDGVKYQLKGLRDISSVKENEAELLHARQKVEEAERLKTAFLDNMPHEIRTPLHAITGFTSLLSDEGLTAGERLEYVKFIQDGCNDILNLIDNIIEIAKLETNQVKPKREKCYINSVIDKLYSSFCLKRDILERGNVTINITKAYSDPMFSICTDTERLFQVFGHMLNNALKFTESGYIHFGYKIPQNNVIEFFVSDTGIGIPDDQKEIIFKKFGKSGDINTNKNRGSGLGLALSKKLVELMNGHIELESEVGKGSTFRFFLPSDSEARISISRPSVLGETNWSTKTILVAEDTDSNYFFIEAFLEKTHVNLLWAQNGIEAVEMFKKKGSDIDLILMDMMMPGMDGFDATKEVKLINPDIPVIAQTALALPDDEEKCYDAGCDYVLVKPINSDDLVATIKNFIH